MNIWIKRTSIGLAVVLVLIQFWPTDRPETIVDNPNDIHQEMVINAEVSDLLKAACYDCHSTEVIYPWYASVAPVSFWINEHIADGSRHLNFSEWATYSPKRKHHKLEEIYEEVEEGEMPLDSYTWIHSEARLTQEQVDLLVNWAKSEMQKINVEEEGS
ncbi:heme-binding domain-containing protein [Marinoscillum sp.]|uniref:heme-binding domain-containing protein n=1 Tax=Marinoscillum sp. TaxID=2024838 RepID=UPI003BAD9697